MGIDMKRKALQVLLISTALLSSVPSISLHAQGRQAQGSYPSDVVNFVKDRDDCDTLRGDIPDPEEGISKADMDDIIRNVNKACHGTDERLAALKQKYSSHPAIMQKLSSYEYPIEAQSNDQ
jgi:hypothetical protein